MKATFISSITNGNASIKSRQSNMDLVLNNTKLLSYLIQMATAIDDKAHHKAVWIIELLAENKCELLIPYFDKLIEVAPKYKNESAIRGISRTINFIVKSKVIKINELQEQLIIELCFDWLINEKIRIAPKVFAIYTLLELSKNHDWILKNLASIVEKDLHNQRPGYKAAAKRVLKKINL
jgi:hypothetical protein